MNVRIISLMDTFVQRAAAAVFAGAVGFAVETTSSESGSAIAAVVAAYLVCSAALKRLGVPEVRMKVPVFDLREFEPLEVDELLLTDTVREELVLTEADRVGSELVLTDSDRIQDLRPATEPLMLDDVLAVAGDDSRVVRLFDRTAMQRTERLSSRVERNHSQGPSPRGGDASEALSQALAELRRSLR